MNSWNVATAEAVVAPEARSAAPSFLPIMTAGMSSSKPAVLAIAMGSPATLLMMMTRDRTCGFGVRDFLAEGARAAINDRQLSGGAGIDAGATVGLRVEEIERRCRQRIEVTDCGADRCSAACGIGDRLADEMLVRARADRDDFARAARRLKRAWAGSAVTSCNGHDHACIDCVVESDRQQVVVDHGSCRRATD